MSVKKMIRIREFCSNYRVDIAFVETLHQTGLIALQQEGKEKLLPENELPQLEKLTRLYADLHINVEGIEVISHLLQKMERMQQELLALQNRLQLYEE